MPESSRGAFNKKFSGGKDGDRYRRTFNSSRVPKEVVDESDPIKKQILIRNNKERTRSPEQQNFDLSTAGASFPQITRRPPPTSINEAAKQVGNTPAVRLHDLPVMSDGVRMIGEHLDFFDQINEFLSDTNTSYTVIGAIGAQGVGKSTLLSMIGGNSAQDMYRQYIFRPCSREAIEGSRHQTSSVYVYVTKARMILIDCQGMNSGSLLDEAIRSSRSTKVDERLEVAKTMEIYQVISFMLHVCHALILNIDWFIDFELIKMLRVAEMLRANLGQVSSQGQLPALNTTRKIHLVVVHARAKEGDFSSENRNLRVEILRKMFADSTRIKIPDDDSTAYICTEEIKLRKDGPIGDTRGLERTLSEDFDVTMRRVRPLLASLCTDDFTKEKPLLTEKQWLRMAKLVWSDSAFNSAAARLATFY